MGWGRIVFGIIGCLGSTLGYCGDVWLIEQDFVKWGKKDAYEVYKKAQQKDFVKKIGFPRVAIEDADASQYIYLIPIGDFKGLNALMKKRIGYHDLLVDGDEQEILPFLNMVNFFIETVHYYIADCSFIPKGKESLLAYPAVYYSVYSMVPGNGPTLEERLMGIVEAQKGSSNPVCFRTWRMLFGGDVPSYVVAVFADTTKEAKDLAKGLQIIDGQMKNVLRQEKKGSGVMRKDLSSISGKQ